MARRSDLISSRDEARKHRARRAAIALMPVSQVYSLNPYTYSGGTQMTAYKPNGSNS